jgi:hypothetical protein
VLARYIRNGRLADALYRPAQSALISSPGARLCYGEQRARGLDDDAPLRVLFDRLVGIVPGCLKTGTVYDEATAWSHDVIIPAAARQSNSGVSLRALWSETKGRAGACPDRMRAVSRTVQARNWAQLSNGLTGQA